jgi:hypothetical protein
MIPTKGVHVLSVLHHGHIEHLPGDVLELSQVTLISAISALLGILSPFATCWPVCPGTDFNVLPYWVLKMSWSLALVE